MPIPDLNPRYLPCQTLRHYNVPCIVWFEDVIRYYGYPTVCFDLYILVPDIEIATQILVQNDWLLVPQAKGKIGNAIVDSVQCRLEPPPQYSDPAEMLKSWLETSISQRPPPDAFRPGPQTTVLLPAADWNFSFSRDDRNDFKICVDFVFPPLAALVDALIDSLLDCPPNNHVLSLHLAMHITALYDYAPQVKQKAFAEQLMYEHRQYHYDILAGMDHGTAPFIRHQRMIREALRQRTYDVQECSAPEDNTSLFSNGIQAQLLASMPNPFADGAGKLWRQNSKEIRDDSDQIKANLGNSI